MNSVSGDRADTTVFGDTSMPEWVIEPAKRTVAANATSVDDLRDLLKMLGLIEPASVPVEEPEPEVRTWRHCAKCGRPGRHSSERQEDWPGTVAIVARGMCRTCHTKTIQAERDGYAVA